MAVFQVPALAEEESEIGATEPTYDPPADELLRRLEDKGVMRYERLVEEDTLPARQTLDALAFEGAIERFAVGEKMMVKLLIDDIEGVAIR